MNPSRRRPRGEVYPYVWTWDECAGCVHKSKKPRDCPPGCTTYRPALAGRKGKRCRVITRGAMNTAIVEFVGGYRTTVSRSALRKGKRS